MDAKGQFGCGRKYCACLQASRALVEIAFWRLHRLWSGSFFGVQLLQKAAGHIHSTLFELQQWKKHEFCVRADSPCSALIAVCDCACEHIRTSPTQHVSLMDSNQSTPFSLHSPSIHPSFSIIMLLCSVFIAVQSPCVCVCVCVCECVWTCVPAIDEAGMVMSWRGSSSSSSLWKQRQGDL